MEFALYALAAIGVLALLLVAGFLIASVFQPDDPRHVDLDLLVEMPPSPAKNDLNSAEAARR